MAAWVAKNKLQTKAFSHQVLFHEEENTAVDVISPSFMDNTQEGHFWVRGNLAKTTELK